jgi:F0F1-type ATP synthase membrane subunit c/vacuolar-type H+-ATPase subunit K
MDKLRAAYRVAVIIGLAMMASLLVYLILVGLFEKGYVEIKTSAVPGSLLEIIKFVLLGASVVSFFLIRVLSNKILSAGRGREGISGGRSRPTAGIAPEFGPLVTAAVVTFALCEAPAIFGLVLFFLGRNSADFHLFLLISLVFFATKFPRFSQWEEWYREQAVRR